MVYVNSGPIGLYPVEPVRGSCRLIGVPIVVSTGATFVPGGTSYKVGGWALPKGRRSQ
jgi:hypothetical protein